MDETTLITLAILIVLLTLWLLPSKQPLKHLHGPWTNGIPFLGSFLILDRKPFLTLTELSKKFGPVYRLRIGSFDIVVLTDFPEMKEAFAKDAFMGRPKDLPFSFSKKTVDTGAFHDIPWKEQKRFCLQMLRDLGFGKSKMEENMKEGILDLLDKILDQREELVNPSTLLIPSMANNIISFIFGKRLKNDDPLRERISYLLFKFGTLSGIKFENYFFPWVTAIRRHFKLITMKKNLTELVKEIKEFCRKEIEEHEKTMDPNNIRDFVDGYLVQIKKKNTDPNSSFSKEVLEDVARLFFAAGSEIMKTTLNWMLLVCAAYPDVQKKIYSEIDEVIGQERFPTWNDHFSMPFTSAAILEIMRWKTSIPLNFLRYTLEDTELNGYFIPKRTLVLPVTWTVDHATKLWGEDVHEYKPERFLSDDGTRVVKPEYSIPFSIGKRSCPGKTLAEVGIFLYLVAIVRKFDVQPPNGKKVNFDSKSGFMLQPIGQEISFKRRT